MANQLNLDTQIKGSRQPYFATDSGAANAYAVATVAPLGPSLKTGSKILFIAAHANTGASTLAVNGGSAIPVKKSVSTALASGDILLGQVVEVVYDGTNFQMMAGAGATLNTFAVVSAVTGKPAASQIVAIYTAFSTETFPANFGSPNQSYGSVGTNPTSTASYTVNKNGSSVGTVSISTSGVFTFTTSGGTSFSLAAGDRLTIVAPSSQDATLADVGITLVGTR